MQSLRRQLFLSHLLLIGLMLLLLLGGVARFFHLGRSIDRVLDANVKSVLLMQQTKDALNELERMGRHDEGAMRQAQAAIRQELGNLTEPGERLLAEDLQAAFADYQAGNGERARVSAKAQAILELNLAAIHRADTQAMQEARNSALLGTIATALAAVLAVVLALRTVRSALRPLVSLAHQAEAIGTGQLNQRILVDRNDEIGTLARAFNEMVERLAEARAALEARLVRAERMHDAALESLYDPVIVTDASGTIVHLNRAAEDLLGQKLGAPVEEATLARSVAVAVREGRSVAEEDHAGLMILKERTYRLRVSPLRLEEETLGAVAVLEDITSLREVDRLKTEFIGVASHELRTPVTSLLLSVQLLQEGAVGVLTPAQNQLVAAQREDLLRLEGLLRDLLDLSKLESGEAPLRRELVVLAELLATAVEGVCAEARAKGVTLEVAVSPALTLRLDRPQLGRALTNLLGNALRHTPRGGTIWMSAQETATGIQLQVRDTGTGIPISYLGSIFERFTQVPGATRGGAGLGLSLARAIVEAHGGTIEAQSAGEGQGSTFTITLRKDERWQES